MSRRKMGGKVGLIAIVVALLVNACTPALPREQVEQELVPYVLHNILPRQLGSTGNFIESQGGRWADAPADASIIVWAPPVEPPDEKGINFVNSDAPNRVWWYANGKLVEVTDKKEAIQRFRQVHFSSSSATQGWGYYEFGILSLARGNREARVYVGVSCGRLCGTGVVYILQRNEAGAWEVKGSEMRWIS